jgi:carboxyl-terminal processing protease
VFDGLVHPDMLVQVVAPAPESPADRAGIRAQDAILAIDGTETLGKSLYEVADLLQGAPGSRVVLHIRPLGTQKVTDVELIR